MRQASVLLISYLKLYNPPPNTLFPVLLPEDMTLIQKGLLSRAMFVATLAPPDINTQIAYHELSMDHPPPKLGACQTACWPHSTLGFVEALSTEQEEMVRLAILRATGYL